MLEDDECSNRQRADGRPDNEGDVGIVGNTLGVAEDILSVNGRSDEAGGGQQQETNADSRVTVQVVVYLLQARPAGTEKESLATFYVRLLRDGPIELDGDVTRICLVVQGAQRVRHLGHRAPLAACPARHRGADTALRAADQLRAPDVPQLQRSERGDISRPWPQ
jgi:hypothetical protein